MDPALPAARTHVRAASQAVRLGSQPQPLRADRMKGPEGNFGAFSHGGKTHVAKPCAGTGSHRHARLAYLLYAGAGFSVVYDRPEEGFAYLRLGSAELMLDQSSLGRTFDTSDAPMTRPFGRGINLQIRVADIAPMLANLAARNYQLHLPVEYGWYRKDNLETGIRQFIVADPDGYLLRFYQDLGERSVQA